MYRAVILTWTEPDCNGAPAVNYIVEQRVVKVSEEESGEVGSVKTWNTTGNVGRHRAEGAAPGAHYSYRVATRNEVGVGEFSAWSRTVECPFSMG